MRRRLSWLAMMLAAALLRPAVAGNLLPGDPSFELAVGHLLRDDLGPDGPTRAQYDDSVAIDGRRSVRLRAGADRPGALVEWPWLRLAPETDYTCSAYLRTDDPGLTARFELVPAAGETQLAALRLTGDWRRYEVVFRTTAEYPCWARLVLQAGAGERAFDPSSVWVDAVQFEPGGLTAFEPRPALSCEVQGGPRLLRAGERVGLLVRLRRPRWSPATRVRWRLEDPFGAPVAQGSMEFGAGDGVDERRLKSPWLRPGAARLVATAEVGATRLVADASVVVASFELGGPESWFGLDDTPGKAAGQALELLRIGLVRSVTDPAGESPLYGADPGRLGRHRRAGRAPFGCLPGPGEGDYGATCRELAQRLRGLVRVWVVPDGLSVAAQAAAFRAVKEVDRSNLLVGLRLPADGSGSPVETLRQAASDGRLDQTDALQLVLGSAAPEVAGGIGLAALLAQLQAELARLGRPLPIGVLASGWVAEPWRVGEVALPLGDAAGRVPVVLQASYLARAMLLARAGEAGCFLYHGAVASSAAETRSLGWQSTTCDLFEPDGAPLPAVAALDQTLDQLRRRRPVESLALARGAVCWRWAGRDGLVTVWQTDQSTSPVTLDLPLEPRQVTVTDLFGRSVAPVVDGTGLRLALGPQPLYVVPHHLSEQDFADAWSRVRLIGLPEVDAVVVPRTAGVDVVLRNLANHAVEGRLNVGGRETPFGPLAVGCTGVLTTGLPAPSPGQDLPLALTTQTLGATSTTHGLSRLLVLEPELQVSLQRLLGGEVPLPADLSAEAALRVLDGRLVLTCDVTDDVVTAGDRVELAFGSPAEALGQLPRWTVAAIGQDQVDGLTVKRASRPGGYRLTLTLPWDGGVRAFDVGVADVDTPGDVPTRLGWAGGWLTGSGVQGWLAPAG